MKLLKAFKDMVFLEWTNTAGLLEMQKVFLILKTAFSKGPELSQDFVMASDTIILDYR